MLIIDTRYHILPVNALLTLHAKKLAKTHLEQMQKQKPDIPIFAKFIIDHNQITMVRYCQVYKFMYIIQISKKE